MINILFFFPPLFIYANLQFISDSQINNSRFCVSGFTSSSNTPALQCSSGCSSRVFSSTISSQWWSSGRILITNSTWRSAGVFPSSWRPFGPHSLQLIRQLPRKWARTIDAKAKRKRNDKTIGAAFRCWLGYNLTPSYWILEGPRLTIIFINLLYLLNILRVLVTKLRNSQCSEAEQLRFATFNHRCSYFLARSPSLTSLFLLIRKSVKAAMVLLPLLGITNALVMIKAPLDRSVVEFALWSYSSHFLTSFQGFFVALLYCFLNGEVSRPTSLFLFLLSYWRYLTCDTLMENKRHAILHHLFILENVMRMALDVNALTWLN